MKIYVLGLLAAVCCSVALAEPAASRGADAQAASRALHADIVRLREGDVRIAPAPVARGDVAISIPVAYRRTGVLETDLRWDRGINHGQVAPAGSPGFLAGAFAGGGTGTRQLWCFLPSLIGSSKDDICVLLGTQYGLGTVVEPYLPPTQFSTPQYMVTNSPAVRTEPVEIVADLRIEYRFRGWSRTALRLEEYAVGRRVQDIETPLEADGSALLNTIAGLVRVERTEDGRALFTLREARSVEGESQWVQTPTGDDFAAVYPAQALTGGVTGRAVLQCRVLEEGRLSCTILSEEPVGAGFGAAALSLSEKFRVRTATASGESTIGTQVQLPIRFELY